jgi:hypothetical protein
MPEQAERVQGPNWTIPLFEAVSLAPLWIWLLTAMAWLGIYLVYAYVVVGDRLLQAEFWRVWGFGNVQTAALIGYVPATVIWAQRGALRTLQALRPTLLLSDDQFGEELRAVNSFSRKALVGYGVFGLANVLLIFLYGWLLLPPEVIPTVKSELVRSGFSVEESGYVLSRVVGWDVARWSVVGSLGFVAFFIGGRVDYQLSRIGEGSTRIDLVDLSPLRPLTERAFRVVGILIGATLLISTNLLVLPRDGYTIALVGVLTAASVVALFGPVRGVHKAIRREKRNELERVRAEIRAAKQAGSTAEKGHLADLIAYEGRIESVNTWLYDSRALLRLALVFGAGVSMIAGALVERAVNAVLG